MRKNKKIKSMVFIGILILLILLMTLFVTFNFNYFNELINTYVEGYGYIGILGFSFIADFLEQPIGPEVPASVGVLFGLNIFIVLLFSVIGSWISSSINFYIGKKYLHNKIHGIFEEKKDKTSIKFFRKYGKLGVALAAISPIPWVAFCWLGGAFKMKFRQFVIYGLIPRAIRIFTVIAVVYYLKIFIV